jgi:hypothetical protein
VPAVFSCIRGGKRLTEITPEQLEKILSGDPEEMDVHLRLVQRDVAVENCKVTLHCHCLTVDAGGKVKIARLAEFMRAMLSDYAIPKRKLTAARARVCCNLLKHAGSASRMIYPKILSLNRSALIFLLPTLEKARSHRCRLQSVMKAPSSVRRITLWVCWH